MKTLSAFVGLCALFLLNGELTHQFSLRHGHVAVSPHSNQLMINATSSDSHLALQKVITVCSGSMGPGIPCMSQGNTCYCFVARQQSWKAAASFCSAAGMQLLSIEKPPKQSDVELVAPQLIGSNPLPGQIGLWTSGTYDASRKSYIWSTSSKTFSYANWRNTDDRIALLDCVRVVPYLQYRWADLECEQWLPSICEAQLASGSGDDAHQARASVSPSQPAGNPIQKATDTTLCGAGKVVGDHCCVVINSIQYCYVPRQQTWADAKEYCSYYGMKLLTIDTPTKQSDVQKALPRITSKVQLVNEIGLWTSGNVDATSKTYYWMGGAPTGFSFVNWMTAAPKYTASRCVRVVPTLNYQWDDVSCGEWLPAVCEVNVS